MSNDLKIGHLITGDAQRDAIHVAVIPLMAGETLLPGTAVALKGQDTALRTRGEGVGIVDPFLDGAVEEGQRFWCFLYPGTVTGMRHHWSHPAFEDTEPAPAAKTPVDRKKSEEWLREFSDQYCVNFREMIDAGVSGDSVHGGASSPYDLTEFWYHLEVYTGKRFDQVHREAMVWSCSC